MSHAKEPPSMQPPRLVNLMLVPAVWAAHFLASYITSAVWCAKVESRSPALTVQWIIVVYTALALVILVGISRQACQHVKHGPTPIAKFLASLTLMLALVSGIAVIYALVATWMLQGCA